MKPKSVEVYPVYICPECHSRYCESLEYVNKVGKILCCCGNLLQLDKIKTIRMNPIYEDEKPEVNIKKQEKDFKPIKQERSEISSVHIDRCIELLVELGWKKREAKSKVNEIYISWTDKTNKKLDEDTIDEFAQYVFFNQGK